MRLYEYDQEISKLIDACERFAEDNDGEISEDLLNELGELKMGMDEKLLNCGRWVKSMVADEKALKDEADKIAKRRKTLTNRIASVKKLIACLFPVGRKLEDSTCVLSYRKSTALGGEDVGSEDWSAHPKWVNTETKKSWDKKGIIKALKEGVKFNGFELEEKQNLQIK